MSKAPDNQKPPVAIKTITVEISGPNTVNVTVTSGTLAGKTARLIMVPPTAAYFNEVLPAARAKAG